jgi:hypothetical protein
MASVPSPRFLIWAAPLSRNSYPRRSGNPLGHEPHPTLGNRVPAVPARPHCHPQTATCFTVLSSVSDSERVDAATKTVASGSASEDSASLVSLTMVIIYHDRDPELRVLRPGREYTWTPGETCLAHQGCGKSAPSSREFCGRR